MAKTKSLTTQKINAIVKKKVDSALEDKVKTYGPSIGSAESGTLDKKPRKIAGTSLLKRLYRNSDPLRKGINVITDAVVVGGSHLEPWKGEKFNERHSLILYRFFDEPNDEDTMNDLNRDTGHDLFTYGDAYHEIVTDLALFSKFKAQLNDNRVDPYNVVIPFKLYRLDPETMEVKTDKDGTITEYIQTVQGGTNSFSANQVIHYKLSSPLDPNYGLAPGSVMQNLIASYIYITDYNGKFFENNATPRLHIDLGEKADPKKMGEFIDKIEAQIKGQPHKNLVTGGGVKVNPISLKVDEEFQNYSVTLRNEILSQLGVMPIIAGSLESVGSTGELQVVLFKTLAVKPIQQIMEDRINRKIIKNLFKGVKLSYKFNPVDALDAKYMSEMDSADLKNQVRTINEVRESRGLAAVSWGDTPVIPFSNASLATLPIDGKPKEKPIEEKPKPENKKPKKRKDGIQNI